jgi:polyhydroxyalkanoate synthase
MRRAQGDVLSALGLGPDECPYRIIASGAHWRLRDYAHDAVSPSLIIVAAPIKRPYIWDLTPSVSAIRYCLDQGLGVHLLEWLPASRDTGNNGLDEYASAIFACIATISQRSAGATPFVIGHSLGGTLAALASAAAPESVRGLMLLGAPLCFKPGESRFRDSLVSLIPRTSSGEDPVPGSLLSQMSVLASPGTFIWSRFQDAALSAADREAMDIHARVERWALDEAALPGRLVREMIEQLYSENSFFLGTLRIACRRVGPFSLSTPTLAVVNMIDEVTPLASVKPVIDAMPTRDTRIIEYPGEPGVCLQHLGILVGRQARAAVWPEIISWTKAHT